MNNELTTAQVAERLDMPERTVRLWCKQGLLPGARSVDTPRGNYWLIPESALNVFEKPKAGRPPKMVSTQKPATDQTQRSSATVTRTTGKTSKKKDSEK